MHSIKTNMKSEILTLITVSKELKLAKPQEVLTVFLKSIKRALEDFKNQFQEYINQELTTAESERKELLLVIRSHLNSLIWEKRLLDMQSGNYKIFNEFVLIFTRNNYFNGEQAIAKYFQKKDDARLLAKITEGLKIVFENTNSAKYANVDKWFEMFARNLAEEFANYSYICWEKVLLDLKDEKPLDFPSLNEILRKLEKIEINLCKNEVEFLKKLKLID